MWCFECSKSLKMTKNRKLVSGNDCFQPNWSLKWHFGIYGWCLMRNAIPANIKGNMCVVFWLSRKILRISSVFCSNLPPWQQQNSILPNQLVSSYLKTFWDSNVTKKMFCQKMFSWSSALSSPSLSSLLRISVRSTTCRPAENTRSSWSGSEPEPVEVILESLPKYCFVPARAVRVRRALVRSPSRRQS